MQIKKVKNSYNDYDCQISFGQLQAIKNALARDHADPLADELYAELEWYIQNVPGPGESEDDIKKAEDAMASGLDQAPPGDQEPIAGQADELLPAPGEEGEEGGMEPGGAEEIGPEPGGEGEFGPEGPEGEGEMVPAGGPPEGGGESEADRRLPPPPEE